MPAVRSGLLVSVRSVAEAESALAGGADLIDVKEPSRGSLGRAEGAVIVGVLRAVDGQRPVSAALGELRTALLGPLPAGVTFWKWGLAGCRSVARWEDRLLASVPRRQLVAVAYADWERADAPAPAAICAFACQHGCGAFLLDTHGKDGSTLLDWLSVADLAGLRARCRAAGVPIALAGSLGGDEIAALRHLQPDWFAVRGAVCAGGRTGTVEIGKVRQLVALLGERGASALPEHAPR